MAIVGYPSKCDMVDILDDGNLKNCAMRSNYKKAMFGPNVPTLKGKTVISTPNRVKKSIILVPPELIENNIEVTLGMDII